MYTLREAAEAVGKGKPAILKAIQKGRISAKKNGHGEWEIDPAELHRVYPPVAEGTASEPDAEEPEETTGNTLETKLLQQEIAFLREKLADLENLRADERRSLSDQVEDLRRERDRLLSVIEDTSQSVKLLTDQREALKVPERRSWWSRMFGTRRT